MKKYNGIKYRNDSINADKNIDAEIQEIVIAYEEKFNAEELEELRGLLYQAALIAEQEGFVLGMRY